MQMQSKQVKGVTLIELMIVISIGAVLTTMALPSFNNLLQSAASRSARSALSVSISQARIGAAMRGTQIVVCPSSNQSDCISDSRWHHGWIAFIDSNRNSERDANEEIIAVTQAQASGVAILSTSGRQRIRYQADGSASGTNLTLTVCDRRGPSAARTLVINNSGRLRSGAPTASQAAAACAAIDT